MSFFPYICQITSCTNTFPVFPQRNEINQSSVDKMYLRSEICNVSLWFVSMREIGVIIEPDIRL